MSLGLFLICSKFLALKPGSSSYKLGSYKMKRVYPICEVPFCFSLNFITPLLASWRIKWWTLEACVLFFFISTPPPFPPSPPSLIILQDLSYKEKHWHEWCFVCCVCNNSLVDKPFGSRDEKIYCGDCYANEFAARCDACSQVFRPGQSTRNPYLFLFIW